MYKKFLKILWSVDRYSGRIFIALCLLSAIIAFTTISVTDAWGDFFYTYPEEQYQELEQEADRIISNLDFNADDLEMTVSDDKAFITIEVENLGESTQEVKIKREYKSQIHQNLAFVLVIIGIILVYLLLLILLLLILVVVVGIFIAIITLILFIIDKIKNPKKKQKNK